MGRRAFALFLTLALLAGCGVEESPRKNSGSSGGQTSAPSESIPTPSTVTLEEKEYNNENLKPIPDRSITAEDLTITDEDMLVLRDQYYTKLAGEMNEQTLRTIDETRGNHGYEFIEFHTLNDYHRSEENEYCDIMFRFYAYTTEQEEPVVCSEYFDFAPHSEIASVFFLLWNDYQESGDAEGLDLILRTLVEYRSHLKWVGGLVNGQLTEEELADQLMNDRILCQSGYGGCMFIGAEDLKANSAIYGNRETEPVP